MFVTLLEAYNLTLYSIWCDYTLFITCTVLKLHSIFHNIYGCKIVKVSFILVSREHLQSPITQWNLNIFVSLNQILKGWFNTSKIGRTTFLPLSLNRWNTADFMSHFHGHFLIHFDKGDCFGNVVVCTFNASWPIEWSCLESTRTHHTHFFLRKLWDWIKTLVDFQHFLSKNYKSKRSSDLILFNCLRDDFSFHIHTGARAQEWQAILSVLLELSFTFEEIWRSSNGQFLNFHHFWRSTFFPKL